MEEIEYILDMELDLNLAIDIYKMVDGNVKGMDFLFEEEDDLEHRALRFMSTLLEWKINDLDGLYRVKAQNRIEEIENILFNKSTNLN